MTETMPNSGIVTIFTTLIWHIRCHDMTCAARRLHVGRTFRFALLLLPLALLRPSSAQAQWGYPPFYPGYPAFRYVEPDSSLRINVQPKDASVYVDGYFAGRVRDFDGAFQRLHVIPGEHEIVVYLEGYRSLRQKLYLGPNGTRTIKGSLERLAVGEPSEPQPAPSAEPMPPAPHSQPPQRGPVRRRGLPPPPHDQQPPDVPHDRTAPPSSSRFATLSIRVQPSGATVFIDGERWSGPQDDERLIVQVAEGRHRIEVEKDEYARYSTDIDVERGRTVPMNISLTREGR